MFDLKITITGICAFVENSLPTGPRVCVVMPSTDCDRNAADDEPLCPHESYIEQGLGRMPLRGHRIRFDVVELGPPNPTINLPLPIATSTDVGLINLIDSGVQNPPDPSVVLAAPPAPVMAQLILDKGSVVAVPEGRHWFFDPTGPRVQVAHEMVITLNQLGGAAIILQPFNGSRSTTLDLTPPAGIPTVALRIVNTCRRGTSFKRARRDRDFKWYYELLVQPSSITTSEDLPIPRVDFDMIGGNNCFPTRLGTAPIP